MLLSVFPVLYELFCGHNKNYPEYKEQIFTSVGTLSLIIPLVICFLFYVVLGRWKMVWYSNKHWGITIFVCALIGFFLAFFITKNILGLIDAYVWIFAFINAILAAVYFIAFSFLFKNLSIYSKRTPF
jgi:hypothetical protein